MTQSPYRSVSVVGGGITGLTIAVALQASGHKVTLIARDAPEETASGVAAGMIAPAMEAMNDPDPAFSFQRLKTAQQAWQTLEHLWPQSLKRLLPDIMDGESYFIWSAGGEVPTPLRATGVALEPLSEDRRQGLGLPQDVSTVRVRGDGRISAMPLLQTLEAHLHDLGGLVVRGTVTQTETKRVYADPIGWVDGDDVVMAAGYDSRHLGVTVVSPIKGHLLDLPSDMPPVVLRGGTGYLAARTDGACFGATMQAGQADTDIEPQVVEDLKHRAKILFPKIGLEKAVPRAGIRASTPDGWPLIGRDSSSGVLVATGMRRNGYIFAPLAARIILALVEGRESPDEGIYRPDRFGVDAN